MSADHLTCRPAGRITLAGPPEICDRSADAAGQARSSIVVR